MHVTEIARNRCRIARTRRLAQVAPNDLNVLDVLSIARYAGKPKTRNSFASSHPALRTHPAHTPPQVIPAHTSPRRVSPYRPFLVSDRARPRPLALCAFRTLHKPPAARPDTPSHKSNTSSLQCEATLRPEPAARGDTARARPRSSPQH
jgi:hypothetical protein